MKYFIFGDIHGRNLNDLEESLTYFSPDALICLGDFDQVSSVRQFMKLEEEYTQKGKIVIKVPGNHDNSIFKNEPIYSGALTSQHKTSQELYYELKKDPVAYNYIEKLLNLDGIAKNFFLDEKKFSNEYPSVVIHGAYNGNLSSCPRCRYPWTYLWYRLDGSWGVNQNFKAMKKNGKKIMIRGHDHNPMHASYDSANETICHWTSDRYSPIQLSKELQHVINPGAFYKGNFALIDTNVSNENCPILTFHKI